MSFFVAKDYGRTTLKKCVNDLYAGLKKGNMNKTEAEASIDVYEWILDQPDAEQKARSFLMARQKRNKNGKLKSRQEVVDELGFQMHTEWAQIDRWKN